MRKYVALSLYVELVLFVTLLAGILLPQELKYDTESMSNVLFVQWFCAALWLGGSSIVAYAFHVYGSGAKRRHDAWVSQVYGVACQPCASN